MMLNQLETMNTYLPLAHKYLPPSTTTSPTFSVINELSRKLPSLPLTVFETHLDDPNPDMDFLLSGSPKHLLNNLPQSSTFKEWQAVQEVCEKWDSLPDTDSFKQGVDVIWLEFDTSVDKEDKDKPAIFFVEGFTKFKKNNVPYHEMVDVLSNLLNKEPSQKIIDQFENLINSLPKGSHVFALGNMSGRNSTSIRVSLANIPCKELETYLKKIKWPGDMARVQAIMEHYGAYFDLISIDLDLSQSIGPKLGIELYMKSRHANMAWKKLFEQLVLSGLCLPEKMEHILNWPGFSNEFTDGDIWPQSLQMPEENGHYLFVRRINHVKLTIDTDKPLKAKAYLILQKLYSRQKMLKMQQ